MADFLFFLFNNHSMFSMFASSKSNPYSRGEKRLAFFFQHCLAFFFAAIVANAGMDTASEILFNCLIIVPVTLFVNKMFYYLLSCPCLINDYEWCICQCISDCIEVMGAAIAYPMALVAFFLLLMASIYTKGDNYNSLGVYAYQIHVLSTFTDTVMVALQFRHNTYVAYSIFGIEVFCTGTWFKNFCDVNGYIEDKEVKKTTTNHLKYLKVEVWKRLATRADKPLEGDIEMLPMVVPSTPMNRTVPPPHGSPAAALSIGSPAANLSLEELHSSLVPSLSVPMSPVSNVLEDI